MENAGAPRMENVNSLPKVGNKGRNSPSMEEEESPPKIEKIKNEKRGPPIIEKEESGCSRGVKKDKVENNYESSQSKITKVVNSISKKREKKMLTKNNSVKNDKRRPINDIDGGSSSYSPSKYRKRNGSDFCLEGCSHSYDREGKVPDIMNESPERDDDAQRCRPKIGFIGLGMMGKNIVTNFIKSGHDVTVWNRTMSKCNYFVSMGAKQACTPAELVADCDITFCCVSCSEVSKAIVFGDHGVIRGLELAEMLGRGPRGYVEMTSIDPESSAILCEAITMKHGMYLEAPLYGTSNDAKKESLIILASGDRKLFAACETCFYSTGKYAYYLSSETGFGNKMSLLLSMLSGTVCVALAETMALAERLNLQKDDLLRILSVGPLQCQILKEKGRMMCDQTFEAVTSLKNAQKDMGLSLAMGGRYLQPMPVTAAANEAYKFAKRSYPDYDMSAIYKVLGCS